MMKDQHQTKTTKDGSYTVYSEKFNQHFHNPNGAVAESRHVFFEESGLLITLQKQSHFKIAEVGFGTGLNLLLLCEYMNTLNCPAQISYYAVEGYPLDPADVEKLNYSEYLDLPEQLPQSKSWFSGLNQGWNVVQITNSITLHLFIGHFIEWELKPYSIDYFFHDPFSIETNPEGWTKQFFSRLAGFAKNDALLSTYAAATKARAAMAAAGWQLASAPGALGKREMTVASPDSNQLKGFKLLDNAKLRRRYNEEFA